MKKLLQKTVNLRVVFLVPAVLIAGLGLFWAGDVWHDRLPNPFLKPVKQLDVSSLNDLYALLQRNFDGTLDAQKLLDGAKAGLVSAAGDHYTDYLTATDAKALSDDLNGQVSGIGAEVGIKNNVLTVIAPVDGSPAKAAGLQAGDIIATINGTTTSG